MGDDPLAERHLREALARDRRFGALTSVARHQAALAEVLDRRGESAEAEQLRTESAALQADLGLGETPAGTAHSA